MESFFFAGRFSRPIGVRDPAFPFRADTKQIWTIFAAFAILILMMLIGFASFSSGEQVFESD